MAQADISPVTDNQDEPLEDSIRKNLHALIHKLPEEQYIIMKFMAQQSAVPFSYLQRSLKKLIELEKKSNMASKATKVKAEGTLFSTVNGEDELYELWDDGVRVITIKEDKDGNEIHMKPKKVYGWPIGEFKITGVFEDPDYPGEYTYNVEYCGREFSNVTETEITHQIMPRCMLKAHYRHILGPCIAQYVRDYDLPIIKMSYICGFTPTGWKLPPEFHIKSTSSIQKTMVKNLEKVMTMPYDPKDAIKQYQELYNATTIDHKDYIFAWALTSPFMHTIKEFLHFWFNLSIYSSKPQMGKSMAAEEATVKFFGHLYAILNKDNFNSESRGGDYISSTTFPIPVDDCGELNDHMKGEMKSAATSDTRFQRKKQDGSFAIDRPYQSTCVYTSQNLPDFFQDTGFAQRLLVLHVESPVTIDTSNGFFKIFNMLTPGLIGRHLIESTKAFTEKELEEVFNTTSGCPVILDSRAQNIVKLLQLGAKFSETFFNQPLNFSDMAKIIQGSSATIYEEITGLIAQQIIESDNIDWDNPRTKNHWIDSPVEKTSKGGKYIYTAVNFEDLRRKFNLAKCDLPTLRNKLAIKWPDVEYKGSHHFHKNTNVAVILIPMANIPKDT